MAALVTVETILLVLLIVLVAGLLRSHAELLRRLGPGEREATDPAGSDLAATVAPPRSAPRATAPAPIAGTTLSGDAVKLDFDGAGTAPTLLAFLSSGCSTCEAFWQTLGRDPLPGGLQTVIVTRGGERERPSQLRSLAPVRVPVLMSSAAWEDYEIPGSPYFMLVDRTVRGEGVATTFEGLSSLIRDALADAELGARVPAGARRGREVDATLAAHGIGPGHPSLYPGREP